MYDSVDMSGSVNSSEALTIADLRSTLDQVGRETATVTIMVVNRNIEPVMEMAIVGLAEDPTSGDFIVMAYPGSVEEWKNA